MNRFMKIIVITLLLIAGLGAGQWKDRAVLNVPRAGAAAVTWGGKIYVFGGKSLNNNVLNSVEVYDPSSDTWDSTIVDPFVNARYNTSAIVWENKIYLVGGRTNDEVEDNVEIYDPVQNKWEEAQELHEGREGHSVNIINDLIYTIGGQEENYHYVDDIEYYNDLKGEWEDAEFEMEYQRAAHFAEVFNNDYYMFGGYYFGLTNTIYKTVPDSKEYAWVLIDTLVEPRAYGATARIGSSIYILGGETRHGKTNRVEIYNAETDSLYAGVNLTEATSGMASAVLDSSIYIIGGFQGPDNEIIDHVKVYNSNVTSIRNEFLTTPTKTLLAKAYPNPFNGSIKIELKIPYSEQMQIGIFNTLGQQIRFLENKKVNPGKYSVFWDAKDNSGSPVSSGLYFVIVKTQTQHQVLKITYVK
ncbi:MAG: T9SS C-terminal target domain-containing protein [Calditrichaeota bacterium]|nr:MAG: T9SS C-terminal target domain-containing protein [Calditrichota bacterium]MBL1206259.1 T9SS C-terminal target domain-containing protein [Calditrichota bacterium]NOG46085.1 T9SS type A sorting domain-containing protein [Calditrichota bacterium]